MRIEVRPSPIHGLGVFALAEIEEGEWQAVYGTITEDETHYAIELDEEDYALEPYPPFRFLNHSEDPNCALSGDEEYPVYILALRDIAPGEELTIDYEGDS